MLPNIMAVTSTSNLCGPGHPEETLATVYCSARESPASTGSPTPTELGHAGHARRGASVAVQGATDMVEPLSA